MLRTVVILRHTDEHLLGEFSHWDIATERGLAVPADMVAVVRASGSPACLVMQQRAGLRVSAARNDGACFCLHGMLCALGHVCTECCL